MDKASAGANQAAMFNATFSGGMPKLKARAWFESKCSADMPALSAWACHPIGSFPDFLPCFPRGRRQHFIQGDLCAAASLASVGGPHECIDLNRLFRRDR